MATWKERGEVPDSDEDDDIESTSLEDDTALAQPAVQSALQISNEIDDDNYSSIYDNQNLQDPGNGSEELQTGTQDEVDLVHVSSPAVQRVEGDEDLSILSSPLSATVTPPAFQVPDWEGLLEEEVEEVDSKDPAQVSQIGLPVQDDISRSYVRITSQASSRQLSPADSLPDLPTLGAYPPAWRSSTLGLEDAEPTPSQLLGESTSRQSSDQARYPMKRALRHRNPIQLHPYVVENEKYRRTLKARGIAPMRLASSQAEAQHVARKSPTPYSDFQQDETQDIARDNGESQAMEYEYDFPQSSSTRPCSAGADVCSLAQHDAQEKAHSGMPIDGNEDEDEDEDEDFPDIDELLRRSREETTKPVARKAQKKQARLKSYSHKFKRHVLPKILTQSSKSKTNARPNQDIFDLPASPPTTSSPMVNMSARLPGQSTGVARSLKPSPSWLSQDEDRQRKTNDLPTPSTSAMKPPTVPISLESDIEDPFADDVESSGPSSSSDESVQIRKITKKFRGVLPASHLRLDQKKKRPIPTRTERDEQTVSPMKNAPRRGVALPRAQSGIMPRQKSSPSATAAAFPFFSDESDEDDPPGFVVQEDDEPLPFDDVLGRSRTGYAEEEDKVDAMLPSRKRLSATSSHRAKKRKLGSGSLHQADSLVYKRQPRITEHLDRVPNPVSPGMPNSRSHKTKRKKKKSSALRSPSPPAIGLLDVAGMFNESESGPPNFIRIAARAARSSAKQGRHKPTAKYFRLATRQDTEDVQSVLKDWSAGRFQPKNLPSSKQRLQPYRREPLSHVQDNQQSHLRATAHPYQSARAPRKSSQIRRKLPVSSHQQSLDDFLGEHDNFSSSQRPLMQLGTDQNLSRVRQKPLSVNHSARPAQLEALEAEHVKRYPSTTFKSSKRALDALYRKSRKRPAPSVNLQLTRFLADEDIVRPSIENPSLEHETSNEVTEVPNARNPPHLQSRQKRPPRRIDVGAAVYRQPSQQLILDHIVPEVCTEDGPQTKLRGLAKFGTRYTDSFDILPLPSGVFFHSSTFIGSGQLSRFTKLCSPDVEDSTPVLITLDHAKMFSWSAWNERVSSEIGLSFDWLVEQLTLDDPAQHMASVDVVTLLCDYLQQNINFDHPLNEAMFLSRMLEVLQDFHSRVQVHDSTQESKLHARIQILSRVSAITLRLLLLSRMSKECSTLVFGFEDLLKAIANQCAKLLLSKDMTGIRKLYDDLQYLSFRDNGIKGNQFIIEAWVVLIRVLSVAKIARGSFWDVVNPVFTDANIGKIIDAPSLEHVWYSMYSLLPLCEFDDHGVVIAGSRHTASFDNWYLPQQLLKAVLDLYKSNQRQPLGFNDYCRALFSRCHCLMVKWGWWNCSGIIGNIFDIFARHDLAHLRNEEVYTSPLFLEELDQSPSLGIESEDRSFHIFLKIVALALKRFSSLNDIKNARNLVARLQPNHNRQYPKEEPIRQQDLASLRNHHDLLCTLFWAAPPSQRPSTIRIEQLVNPSRSHAAAVVVRLKAFRILLESLCVGNQEGDEDTKDRTALGLWLKDDMETLFRQYEAVEDEIRKAAAASTIDATETQICHFVTNNKTSLLDSIRLGFQNWVRSIETASRIDDATKALNPALAANVLSHIRKDGDCHINGLLRLSVRVIETYLAKVRHFRPGNNGEDGSSNNNPDEDSQTTTWGEADMYTADIIAVGFLNRNDLGCDTDSRKHLTNVHTKFAILVRDLLGRPDISLLHTDHVFLLGPEAIIHRYVIGIWARMAAIFIDAETCNASQYLTSGVLAVFEGRMSNATAREYWPYFLTRLVSYIRVVDNLQTPVFDLECLWLIILAEPLEHAQSLPFEDVRMLSSVMYENRFPLTRLFASLKPETDLDTLTATIKSMDSIYSEENADTINLAHQYKSILTSIESTMQTNLESMQPHTPEHDKYLDKARTVVACITSYAGKFHHLSSYFSSHSRHYWPDEKDPGFFLPKLVAYGLRLDREPGPASREMFHFLCHSWQKSLKDNRLGDYGRPITRCLETWSCLEFMLIDFLPIVIVASFHGPMQCWPVFFSYIRPVVEASERVLSLNETSEHQKQASQVFGAVFYILMRIHNMIMDVDLDHSDAAMTACQLFWLSIRPALRVYIQTRKDCKRFGSEIEDIAKKMDWLAGLPALATGITAATAPPPPFSEVEFAAVDAACGFRDMQLDHCYAVNELMDYAAKGWIGGVLGRKLVVQAKPLAEHQPFVIADVAKYRSLPGAWNEPLTS